ncbi:universal stress protein [Neoaquamicrobium sediminum]|uniref:universal stress protein n=2 Tax=Neoaquamicrobium sediminum TaxID=1849104 RepID=UPI0035E40A99
MRSAGLPAGSGADFHGHGVCGGHASGNRRRPERGLPKHSRRRRAAVARHGLRPEVRLNMGDPGPEICAVAREIDADLVVIGHRQHGTLARWWSGSVATYLADHLTCSLLIGRMEMSNPHSDRPKVRSKAL